MTLINLASGARVMRIHLINLTSVARVMRIHLASVSKSHENTFN